MGAVRAAGKRAQQAYKLAMAIHLTRCITGQVVPAYRAWHAGLMGPVSTCIQGITCRPYSSWGYLHTGHVMQALKVLGYLQTG